MECRVVAGCKKCRERLPLVQSVRATSDQEPLAVVLPPCERLNAGQTGSFTVLVAVPSDAANNAMDTATVTATSQGDPMASDMADLTTTATGQEYLLYLPIVPKLAP